ncbi:MAG TPA: hypothetical protein VNH22_10360 [Blastocatellia bacterium]|jgi:hypothetical protein|nr:hypothetical protein [Blastocatellia bacterium]
MQVLNTFFRGGLSLALTLALTSVFSLGAFAAPPGERAAGSGFDDKTTSSTLSGMLTGTGRVTINGNAAQTGATILSGSTIETGQDGSASIDLGPLGQVELQPNTSVTLVLMPGMVQLIVDRFGAVSQSLPPGVVGRVKMQSQPAHFTVARGRVEVSSSGGQQALNGGEEDSFNGASEAVVSGDTSFQLESERADNASNQPAQTDGDAPPVNNSTYVGPGPFGYILLAGLAGTIALGVMAGSNGHAAASGIPPRASEIIP